MDYKASYMSLRAAVITLMDASERDSFEAAFDTLTVEPLVEFLGFVKNERNLKDTLNAMAIQQHELMLSYERAGFTHIDAMTLLMEHLSNASKSEALTALLNRIGE